MLEVKKYYNDKRLVPQNVSLIERRSLLCPWECPLSEESHYTQSIYHYLVPGSRKSCGYKFMDPF